MPWEFEEYENEPEQNNNIQINKNKKFPINKGFTNKNCDEFEIEQENEEFTREENYQHFNKKSSFSQYSKGKQFYSKNNIKPYIRAPSYFSWADNGASMNPLNKFKKNKESDVELIKLPPNAPNKLFFNYRRYRHINNNNLIKDEPDDSEANRNNNVNDNEY